jgi:hypothetical protein
MEFFLVSRRETFDCVDDVVIPYRDIELIPEVAAMKYS